MKLLWVETAVPSVLRGACYGRKMKQNAFYTASILRRMILRRIRVQEIFISK